MAKAYVIEEDGRTKPMTVIRCTDEEQELQLILENNPDLIPGDQINPADPRRWLSVKREMPVPDPNTGVSRWSIDFFFVDQDAMPTFIECKRFNDTRSRREVVGQMFEYAANGHHYWTKEELREYAEETANQNGISLNEEIQRLQPEDTDTVDVFFQRLQDNLREGQVRIVFFLEEAPMELKSVVDFLNKQMERSEILIVEARQYLHEGIRIVTPTLFGYTEEARQVKKSVSIKTGQRKKWDRSSFFTDAEERLEPTQANAIRQVFNKCESLHCEFSWGTGKTAGSFSAKWPHLGKYSVMTIFSDGYLTVNFGSFNKNTKEEEFRDFLKDQIVNKLNLAVPEDYEKRYPNYKITEWSPQVEELIQVLNEVIAEYPSQNA